MAKADVYSSPAMSRVTQSLGSPVDSPLTERKAARFEEYKALARYCIVSKLKAHPRQPQAGLSLLSGRHSMSSKTQHVAKCLYRVAMEVESRYNAQFNDMCSRLRVTSTTAYTTFAAVASDIFSSGVNWGRIAALFSFAWSLAWQLLDRGLFSLVGSVADWVAQFIEQNLGEWITSTGDWDAFVKRFGGKCQEELAEEFKGSDTNLQLLVMCTLAAGCAAASVALFGLS